MTTLLSTDRVQVEEATSAIDGHVLVCWPKALWLGAHALLSGLAILVFPDPGAILVLVLLTVLTICAGHSIGMHRLLIHRPFRTKRWLEYLLVWLGTLVGMAGPFGMIRAHDMRDWHQRQTECPAHPAHRAGFWKDAWWQLCCEFRLDHPPRFRVEGLVSRDRFYRMIDRTWMIQQVPLALVLFALGGWGWVLWGCSVRIVVSLVGHWAIGHFAHRAGHQGWAVAGVAVQGYNLPRFGLVTFGESWHGNHHAFPHSARLGVESGQSDPGFRVIRWLEARGLVWDVRLPSSEPPREGLVRLPPGASGMVAPDNPVRGHAP